MPDTGRSRKVIAIDFELEELSVANIDVAASTTRAFFFDLGEVGGARSSWVSESA